MSFNLNSVNLCLAKLGTRVLQLDRTSKDKRELAMTCLGCQEYLDARTRNYFPSPRLPLLDRGTTPTPTC